VKVTRRNRLHIACQVKHSNRGQAMRLRTVANLSEAVASPALTATSTCYQARMETTQGENLYVIGNTGDFNWY